MSLDFPTVAIIGYLLCVGIAIGFSLMLVVLRGQPVLRLWTLSLWLLAVSVTLLGLRAQLPQVPAILLGNATIAASGVLMLCGVARHLDYRLPLWQPLALAALFMAGIAVFLIPFPSLAIRLDVFSLFAVLLNGWMAWLLLRRAPDAQRTSCRLAAAVFATEGAVYLVRLFLPVAPDAGEDILRTGSPMFLTYIAGVMLELARCFALVLLLVERMLVDLRRLARTDGLTGLLNRSAVLADGSALQAACRQQQRPLALLLLDVDHFKQVNDRWGHLAGDRVLRNVAGVLATAVADRPHLLGRYGGEEFVLLLPDATPQQALAWANRLRDRLQAAPASVGSTAVPVTASIGVAADPGQGDLAGLLAAADAALYKAKAEGRDRAVGARADGEACPVAVAAGAASV
ncbi:GGDEF domain-containing protein [Stenotrophomonas sp. NPDC077421]|uniref:GGDEF domain-containing protein n=1 Tax=Stenotrophomonas sp. NPDC077421 TaxID=3414699 RepID=UPI003C3079EA